MRSKLVFVTGLICVLVLLFACLPLESTENEIIIQTSRLGYKTNVDLVYARDGLTGAWNKLTGTSGVYKFKVKNSDGLYSVVAVSKTPNATEVALFNASLSETKNIFLTFNPIESDFATLTINLPSNYSNENMSIFFLYEHSFPTAEDNKVEATLPKGKGDLVIYVGNPWQSPGIKKVAILRDFEFFGDKTIDLSSASFFDPVEVAQFEGIYSNWLVGSVTFAFSEAFWNQGDDESFVTKAYAIPSSLKSSKDLYVFFGQNSNAEDGGPYVYFEYKANYPTSKPFDLNTITLQPLPETPFSTETSQSGNLIIDVAEYDAGLTGMKTVMYELRVIRYKQVTEFGQPVTDVQYDLYLSSKYVDKSNGEYAFPVISDAAFANYLIKDNQKVELSRIITTNGNLKDIFTPYDGLKEIRQPW